MKCYIKNQKSVKEFSKNEFCKFSLSARDYRVLSFKNNNSIKLKKMMLKPEKIGKEIGSENYMKKSRYRFLKTVNLSNKFLLDETSIEYCKPKNKIFPKYGDILIAKDGGGDGLGEVAYYPYENKENKDSLSSGIIAIDIKEEKRYYVLGFLKSNYFKNFMDLNTAQGSTIRHSKKIALECEIPFSTIKNHKFPKKIEKYVSLLVQNIIDKEKQIKNNNNLISEKIKQELKNNQTRNNFKYNYPKISEIKNETRLDTGLYEKEFKKMDDLIDNYSGGFFQIPAKFFKSGSTPKIRLFNSKNKKYNWVTPTNILDEGFYNPIVKIDMPTSNNINADCILFINRTSKGKKGEFVGITCFYDVNLYGKGQHNQGLYRIDDYDKEKLLFITALINSALFRKICGYSSIGSKMKELKSYDFSKLKFPKFPNKNKKEIINLYYYNSEENLKLTLDNYLLKELERNKIVGIFQLNIEIVKLKKELENIIDKIVMNEKINIPLI